MFAFRVGEFALHCSMCVARLPNASVVHVFEIGSAMEIEEVRAGVVPVTFGHLEFQGQKVRHHDFGMLLGERSQNAVVVFPKATGIVLHVFPVPSIEPAGGPKHLIQNFRSAWCVHILEVAHSHATSDAVGNSVFQKHDVLYLVCFGKEVGDFFFGGGKFVVNSEASA